MGIRAQLRVNQKKEVCPYRHPLPAASQQNTANHFSLLWDTPISRRCSGDVLSEKSKWENLASAITKKVTGAKHVSLEEALPLVIGQLNAKNCTATDKVFKEGAQMICKYYCILLPQ
jgi:hypothetical protein